MKITEFGSLIPLIKSKSNISVGEEALFFATENFNFKGIEILKGSLVHYNGIDQIAVNKIRYGVLIAYDLTSWDQIKSITVDDYCCLWFDGDFYTYGSATLKQYYGKIIDNEEYPSSCSAPFIENILSKQNLKYNDIVFSSIWYHFTLNNGTTLTQYINMSDYAFKSKSNKSFLIPPCVEVMKNDFYPLKEISILGIATISDVNFIPNTERLTFQRISKDIETVRIDYNKGYILTIRKSFYVEIDLDAIIYMKLFVDNVIENWRLKLAES